MRVADADAIAAHASADSRPFGAGAIVAPVTDSDAEPVGLDPDDGATLSSFTLPPVAFHILLPYVS